MDPELTHTLEPSARVRLDRFPLGTISVFNVVSLVASFDTFICSIPVFAIIPPFLSYLISASSSKVMVLLLASTNCISFWLTEVVSATTSMFLCEILFLPVNSGCSKTRNRTIQATADTVRYIRKWRCLSFFSIFFCINANISCFSSGESFWVFNFIDFNILIASSISFWKCGLSWINFSQ